MNDVIVIFFIVWVVASCFKVADLIWKFVIKNSGPVVFGWTIYIFIGIILGYFAYR